MHKRYSKFLGLIHSLGDLIILNVSFIIALYIAFSTSIFSAPPQVTNFLLLFNLFWLIIIPQQHLYEFMRQLPLEEVVWKLIKATVLHVLLVTAYIVFIGHSFVSNYHLLITYIIFIFSLIIWRLIMTLLLKIAREKGMNYRTYVIVGAGPVGEEVYEYLQSRMGLGYKFIGFFDDNPQETSFSDKCLGNVDNMEKYCLDNEIDEIFCALPPSATNRIYDIIKFGENNLVRVKLIPDFRRYLNKKVNMIFYGSIPVVTLRHEPLQSLTNRIGKRTFDIVFSTLVIVFLLSWLVPIIGIIIKLNSKGPVFFGQDRSGKDNEVFKCLKFRSMAVNEDSDTVQATKNDMRITSVGAFLRKSSLDELPQFFNVFMGDMSVVGPRPHMLKHTEEYSEMIDKFMVRHFVKPGITGLAQVTGYRGETETVEQMSGRVKADVMYLENWSILLDFKIVFMTVFNVAKGEENAY